VYESPKTNQYLGEPPLDGALLLVAGGVELDTGLADELLGGAVVVELVDELLGGAVEVVDGAAVAVHGRHWK